MPNDLHRDYVVPAARAGVHVLCAKPIAVDSTDAEPMVAACKENDVKLMVAYRLHFEAATPPTTCRPWSTRRRPAARRTRPRRRDER